MLQFVQAQIGSQGSGLPPDSGIRYKELKKENENLKTEMESLEAAKVNKSSFFPNIDIYDIDNRKHSH